MLLPKSADTWQVLLISIFYLMMAHFKTSFFFIIYESFIRSINWKVKWEKILNFCFPDQKWASVVSLERQLDFMTWFVKQYHFGRVFFFFHRFFFGFNRKLVYRIVASRSTSRLVTCLSLLRFIMKGIFGPYVLWPFDKKLIFWIVTRVSARDYTVFGFSRCNG